MSGGPESVLLSVTIDTECDHDPQWRKSDPLGFRSVTEGIPERLQPLFEEAGAAPTYLLTVEVMEDEESVEALRGLTGAHELGTHLHAAFIEPEKKFHDYAGVDSPDFQCHYPGPVEHAKLANLTALFQQRFGYQPRSFRAGRFGAGPHTIGALTELGYTVDTSVTPHILWREAEGNVDYRGAPEQPYFPLDGNLSRPGGNGPVLEMPVTMRRRWLRGPRWFRPWFSPLERMKQIVAYHLKRYRDRPLLSLNMMFHSMEVIPRASPYPQTEAEVQRYLDDLGGILRWCRNEGIEFCSAGDFGDRYRQEAQPGPDPAGGHRHG